MVLISVIFPDSVPGMEDGEPAPPMYDSTGEISEDGRQPARSQKSVILGIVTGIGLGVLNKLILR